MKPYDETEQAYKNGYEQGVKELAERAKGYCCRMFDIGSGHEAGEVVLLEFADIDNLVKELTEGKEEK